MPKQPKSPSKQKITCKGCGKRVLLLLSHLERTQSPCKDAYDMKMLRAEANNRHKEQMATRNRARYHNDLDVSSKKKAASREYYEAHPEERKAVMTVYNTKNKDKIDLSKKKHYDEAKLGEGHKCPICDMSFPILSEVRRHLNNIHSEKDWYFTCSVCEKAIKYRDNLDRHMREVHGEEKKYKCDECPAAYSRKENLEQHKKQEKHYLEFNCQYCKKTLIYRYVAEKEKHLIHIECDHSRVYAHTCQGIIDERIKKANMVDKCYRPPNHMDREAEIVKYYEKNKLIEGKKSAFNRLYCDHPKKEEKAMVNFKKYGKHNVVNYKWTECDCETHSSITCCTHHKLSHYTDEGYLDCHPFGATCDPGCDDCGKCMTPLESYKRDLGIEYENKWGYKRIGKYSYTRHLVKEQERFWDIKSSEYSVDQEWNGEEWVKMRGYYDCLFCKQKVIGVSKEDHLVHDKKGILTCVAMKKITEEPYSPCKHIFCHRCGGRSEKDPWEKELKGPFSCRCKKNVRSQRVRKK